MNLMSSIKIIVVEPTYPARVHKRKKWMTENYHKRIQKKWLKRFGTTYPPELSNGNVIHDSARNVIYCTPAQYHYIKNNLN